MMSTGVLSGVKVLRWSAALLLVGALLLGALSGSLALAALAFGSGAILLGLGHLFASQDREGRLIGLVLVTGGAFTILDSGVRMLFEAGL